VKFTPLFIPRGEHSLLFIRSEQIISPPGITVPTGDKILPWGTTSPPGRSYEWASGHTGLDHRKWSKPIKTFLVDRQNDIIEFLFIDPMDVANSAFK
jgi:hypothetical protein